MGLHHLYTRKTWPHCGMLQLGGVVCSKLKRSIPLLTHTVHELGILLVMPGAAGYQQQVFLNKADRFLTQRGKSSWARSYYMPTPSDSAVIAGAMCRYRMHCQALGVVCLTFGELCYRGG